MPSNIVGHIVIQVALDWMNILQRRNLLHIAAGLMAWGPDMERLWSDDLTRIGGVPIDGC